MLFSSVRRVCLIHSLFVRPDWRDHLCLHFLAKQAGENNYSMKRGQRPAGGERGRRGTDPELGAGSTEEHRWA